MSATIPYTSETCAQTAKRVRAALKAQYPGVKFSVRSSTYSGGASIDCSFTDGPRERDVYLFLQPFAGADFDGMTDMKSYRDDVLFANADGTFEAISSGADFVHAQRTVSQAWREDIAREIANVTGQPCDLTSYHDDHGGQIAKRNGAGWDARYDAYVMPDDCPACLYGRAADGADCARCDGRGTVEHTARIVPAGDTPQT